VSGIFSGDQSIISDFIGGRNASDTTHHRTSITIVEQLTIYNVKICLSVCLSVQCCIKTVKTHH